MSVFKRAGAAIYEFDFVVKGHRFCGTTGCTEQRAAERVEAERKAVARAEIQRRAALETAPLTMNVACDRYWLEAGQFHPASMSTLKTLARLNDWLGRTTLLSAIDNAAVAKIIARRRGEGVSNGTVNRTVTEPLRRLLYRARDIWGQQVQRIEWKRHILRESKERVRELSGDEEQRLIPALREDFRPLVRFALLSGLRMSEAIALTWADVDWGNRVIRIIGKGDDVATIPLSRPLRELLWPLQGHHPDSVFSFVVTHKREPDFGLRRPITISGLKSQWRRARKRAGLKSTREDPVRGYRFHDNRHTAGTRLLRSSRNLKIVQKVLRHSDIATTTKYAHVLDEDVREAMDAVASPVKTPVADATNGLKMRRKKAK